jgi:regulatory protein
MPQISSIEPQKNRKSRYNVFIDGEFWLGLSDLTIVKNGLKKGVELTDELKKAVEFDEAYEKQLNYCLRLLAGSDRTLKEIGLRLKRRQVPEDVSVAVLEKLKTYSLIDDSQFVRKFVENRPGHGYWWFVQKLKEKGIKPDEAKKALEEYLTPEIEEEYARIFLGHRSAKLKGLEKRERRMKMIVLLKSRGFRSNVISNVLKEDVES